jgi:hypothetical protein
MLLAAVEHSETITKSFTVAGPGRILVDNINGSIRVTGHAGRDVRVIVREHWRADSPEKLAEGRTAVRLDATQTGDEVKLYVDGPFRRRDGTSFSGRTGYSFRHEFDIAVPRTAETLIRNVNGSVELEGIGGGSAHTVNGRIRAGLSANPAAPISFKTINGEIEVEFQPGLAADLRFKTFNGKVYTDFEFDALPRGPARIERAGARSVYRMDRFSGVRVGGGGVEHRFETLNGNIRILRRGN